jgi:protein-L-isoaspartate(D-aspartate) O-methyltransferase
MCRIYLIALFLFYLLSVTCGHSYTVREGQEEEVITFRKDEDLDSRIEDRLMMVETQIKRRGVKDEKVLKAMRKVPRHLFVPENQRDQAYNDYPLKIGHGQTISQPYIVALMTELLKIEPEDKILEIGTGSGYQAAILAELASEVYTIEIVAPLAQSAEKLLGELDYSNIKVQAGDGFFGWPEEAPFDGIMLTAAPVRVPQPLLEQLKNGGRLVVPEGKFYQDLVVYEKIGDQVKRREVIPVRFVPMTGRAEKQ